MDNKPIVIFTAFMVVALIVIIGYLIMSNPFGAVSSAAASEQHGMGDQQAMILYLHNCASCHGTSGDGLNGNPSLINNNLNEAQIADIIHNGKGKMPGLPKLTEEQVRKLASFVKRF